MSDQNDSFKADEKMLVDARAEGGASLLRAFLKLSGPGWLQSAITLGGGSLASSLFLGILAGYSLMWLQPFAMILGIIMLSAIGYVTLSTGEQPFVAIRDHVNPVLAWGWALAVAAANIVWCMPQFALANGVLTQNLFPGFLGSEGILGGGNAAKAVVSVSILIVCTIITWSYDKGGRGLRLYELMLKLMVGLVVLCFAGVVITLSMSEQGLPWGDIFSGLVPNFGQLFAPAATFNQVLDAVGKESGETARTYWNDYIVGKQRDVMIAAAATAVGINMTFLFPYSMLRKKWNKEFRGLAIFDLSTGMFIPYVLATGCVVIASAAQFHTQITDDFVIQGQQVIPPQRFEEPFEKLIAARNGKVEGEVTLAERKIAAMLVNRKAGDLSGALAPLSGKFVADIVFGVGVLAMALSTISLLMLISGFVLCEILGVPQGGVVHRAGTLVAGGVGALGPFFWSGAAFYLAVPTSVFGFVLLPFAYITFVLLMNQRSLLGDTMPSGGKRWLWNILMGGSATIATIGSLYMINVKAGIWGFVAVGIFVGLAVAAHFTMPKKQGRS